MAALGKAMAAANAANAAKQKAADAAGKALAAKQALERQAAAKKAAANAAASKQAAANAAAKALAAKQAAASAAARSAASKAAAVAQANALRAKQTAVLRQPARVEVAPPTRPAARGVSVKLPAQRSPMGIPARVVPVVKKPVPVRAPMGIPARVLPKAPAPSPLAAMVAPAAASAAAAPSPMAALSAQAPASFEPSLPEPAMPETEGPPGSDELSSVTLEEPFEIQEPEFEPDPNFADFYPEESEEPQIEGSKMAIATMPATTQGLWLKAHVYRQGVFMVADLYVTSGLMIKKVTLRVDMRQIAAKVKNLHAKLHGSGLQISGCPSCTTVGGWGSLTSFVSKVAKSTLVKKINNTTRSIIKSKELGAGLMVAAAAFPPVGAPALAGYAAANSALAAVEKAEAVKQSLKGTIAALKKNPKLPRPSAAIVTKAKAAVAEGAKARKLIENLKKTATTGTAAKRADAQKVLKVLNVVAKTRKDLKAIAKVNPKAVTGLVIDSKGRVMHGKFAQKAAQKGAAEHLLLAAKGKTTRGYFAKVSGCIGCS